MEILTKRLNELIEEKRITIKELADGIGASKALVTIWTQGKSLPSVIYLSKIADYFDVSCDYLLGKKDIFQWYFGK